MTKIGEQYVEKKLLREARNGRWGECSQLMYSMKRNSVGKLSLPFTEASERCFVPKGYCSREISDEVKKC